MDAAAQGPPALELPPHGDEFLRRQIPAASREGAAAGAPAPASHQAETNWVLSRDSTTCGSRTPSSARRGARLQRTSALSRELGACSQQVCGGEMVPVLLGRAWLWLGPRRTEGQGPRRMMQAGFGPGLLVTAEQQRQLRSWRELVPLGPTRTPREQREGQGDGAGGSCCSLGINKISQGGSSKHRVTAAIVGSYCKQ